MLLLTGEPGIGKSRLAEHLAGSAAAAGCTVVWGRCWEAGGAPEYWPWIQVFRGLRMEEDPFAEAGRDPAGPAELVRFRAFDRAVTRLRERARVSPLALVLDDLHAADVPSLLLLLLLARELRRSPIVVLGAYRDSRAELAPDVAAVLERIAREGEPLALSRLTPEQVADWVRDAVPTVLPEQCDAVYQVTEGHPLFVSEVLRTGFPRVTRTHLLDGLRAVLDERLSRLPPETRALLEVASVLGREFVLADVAAAAGIELDAADRALRQARDAQVVAPCMGTGRCSFSHVLLRDRLYSELLPSRKAALHWALGSARLARGGDPAEAVHHLLEGHSAGDAPQACATALAAAQRALRRFAFEQAAQLCQRALSLDALGPEHERLEGELRLTLARALMRMGDEAQGKKVCMQVSTLARRIGAGGLFAEAALVFGSRLFAGFGDSALVALLREALLRLEPGNSAIRAKLMARLSAALNPPLGPEIPEILGLAREATAMARSLDDEHALLDVLQSVASGLVYLLDEEARFSLLEEIMRLARGLDHRVALLERSGWYIAALLAHCHTAQAARELEAYEKLLAEFPQPHFQWRRPLAHAWFRALEGNFVEADRLSAEARALAQAGESGPGLRAWSMQRMSFALMCGRPELIGDDAPALMALFEPTQPHVPSTALVLAALRQPEAAERRLRTLRATLEYFPALVFAAETCVLLAHRERAEALYAPLLASAPSHHMFWGPVGASAFGPTARILGDLASLTGRAEQAVKHYDEAIEFCERIGALPFIALARQGRERALAQLAQPGVISAPAAPAAPPPAPAQLAPAPAPAQLELRREGDIWSIERDGRSFRLKHSKGLAYLQNLLERPGRQVHVLELAGIEHAAGDAGPVLDARAKAEYRERLDQLSDELREAERFADAGRRAKAQAELDALAEQLSRAVGLGGKDRLAASDIERARINVQRRIKDALERIAAHDAPLARQLTAALHTGTYCCYEPARVAPSSREA